MAKDIWIESHTLLSRHRKLIELAKALRLRPVYLMGHLHSLWHAAIEQQEDGDLSSWSDEFIAESAQFSGDAPQFVRLLQTHKWLDGRLLHDWIDYAGLYLTRKYASSNRQRLIEIWRLHGREYGHGDYLSTAQIKSSERIVNGTQTVSERIVNLPDLTLPDLTKKTIPPTPLAGGPPNDDSKMAYADFEKQIISDWNSFCQKHPLLAQVKEVTASRRKKIKMRYDDALFRDFPGILGAIAEQPFLINGSDSDDHKNWRVSFDWLILNDTNYVKVLERKYLQKRKETYDFLGKR